MFRFIFRLSFWMESFWQLMLQDHDQLSFLNET